MAVKTWGAQQAYLEPAVLKRLTKTTPWRTTAALVFDWIVILGAAALALSIGAWWAYCIAVVVIAGRMHALAGLVHDFAHYHYLRDKRRSDLIGNIFAAWPLLITVQSYRNNHLAHHQNTNGDTDPDWQAKDGVHKFTFPMSKASALKLFSSYFVGIGAVVDMRSALVRINAAAEQTTLSEKLPRLLFYAAIALVLTFCGGWTAFFLLWALPFFTLFFFFMYVRSVAEHFGVTMDHSSELTASRTVIPAWWEGWLFAPHNLNYHLDHHLYPSVPFYRLKDLHGALMQHPQYAAQAHITEGYTTGLLREVGLFNVQHQTHSQVSL
ncbi:MAG: fatty acid desaturase family protein [Pseudomonadota bacterium]